MANHPRQHSFVLETIPLPPWKQLGVTIKQPAKESFPFLGNSYDIIKTTITSLNDLGMPITRLVTVLLAPRHRSMSPRPSPSLHGALF